MRVAISGISHETSTFVDTPTMLADFENGFGLFRGDAVIERFRGANICTGGFIDGAAEHGFEVVPLLWTFAYPSGLIRREDYEQLKRELLDRLRAADVAARLDGALLDLHGAMVVEGIDDGDADVIEAVRGVLGPERPIVVTFDLHGNHTPRRVAAANAIVGFDTYPHVDMHERGREAAEIVVRTLHGEIRPVMAIRQIPLFWGIRCQVTAHPPMTEVMERVHEIERRPGIVSVTVATGFPWADVPDVGASVIVVADRNDKTPHPRPLSPKAGRGEAHSATGRGEEEGRSLAQATANELGDWIWAERERWYTPPMSVHDAITAGEKLGRHPIILADHGDNTGGGAPGDSTEVLRTMLELRLRDAVLLYMVDLEVVAAAHAAGVGRRIAVRLGGKSHPVQGPPVELELEIVALSDGKFAYDGPMYAGLTGNMGRSAWLRTGGEHGVSVVVVTAREQPLDPAFARTLGIDCTRMQFIAVKSAAHFRSGFAKIAGTIFNVDAAAILTHDFTKLQYRKRTRPVFPVEVAPAKR